MERISMSNESQPTFSYGGQAVIEGVMMRGAHKAAVAARDPNGKIQITEFKLNATLYRGWVAKTPFVRGLVGLWDALGLGTNALLWSANIALVEGAYYRVDYQGKVGWVLYNPDFMRTEGDLTTLPTLKNAKDQSMPSELKVRLIAGVGKPIPILKKPIDGAKKIGEISAGEMVITGFLAEQEEDFFSGLPATVMIIISLAMGIGLFFLFPTVVSSGVGDVVNLNTTGTNIVEEAVKLSLFLGYLLLIGQMPEVKRLFQYHGAEHKTINAYEAGAELTPSIVQTYPIEHPRCGTAFLLNVIIISVILNTLIGRFDNNLLLLVPARLITIPVVAGIAYEWLRLTAKYVDKPLVRVLITPNLMLQRLTTNYPEEEMLEVAIAAFEKVLESEGLNLSAQAAIPMEA